MLESERPSGHASGGRLLEADHASHHESLCGLEAKEQGCDDGDAHEHVDEQTHGGHMLDQVIHPDGRVLQRVHKDGDYLQAGATGGDGVREVFPGVGHFGELGRDGLKGHLGHGGERRTVREALVGGIHRELQRVVADSQLGQG